MKVRAPANIYLHRAQVILLLAAIVPTILTTPLGIMLLAEGGGHAVAVVAGVLVLAFCASSIGGYVLGSMFLRRSASLVDTQNEFLSSVSHELRTPMTSMRMFLEALLDDRLTDRAERERCLIALQTEMVRLDDLIGRLLDLSRLEPGRESEPQVSIPVRDIVKASMAAFDAIKLNAKSHVNVTMEPDLYVMGNQAALTQVFVNLLSNAWKHGDGRAKIEFVIHSAGKRKILFIVRDDGPGIPTAERRKIFEMFERGSEAVQRGTKGSGIGLAVVNAIVERHRGRIVVASSPGGGAEFRVLLRRARPSVEGS